MLFYGTYPQSIDAKGRVIVPAAFRESLGQDFMIGLNSTTNAIAFYPREKWEHILEDLRQLPSTDEYAMDYVRFIAGNSFAGYELDAQGRTMLPAALRQLLQLNKNISFVGMIDYFEVWDTETYDARNAQVRGNMSERLRYISRLRQGAAAQPGMPDGMQGDR